jgi:hypothetical protein
MKINKKPIETMELEFNSLRELLDYVECSTVDYNQYPSRCGRTSRFFSNTSCKICGLSNYKETLEKCRSYDDNKKYNKATDSDKLLTIYYDCTNWINTKDYKPDNNRGIITGNLIELLENKGYKVRLQLVWASEQYGVTLIVKVKMKDYREVYNKEKCIFSLSNPAFGQHLCTRAIEAIYCNKYHQPVFGYPKSLNLLYDAIELKDEDIVVHNLTNYPIAGNDIQTDARQLLLNSIYINSYDVSHNDVDDFVKRLGR